MNRAYRPSLVAFHWLLSVLVLTMLTIGFLWLRTMPNSNPHKLAVIAIHIVGGLVVAILLAARALLRFDHPRRTRRSTSIRIFHGVLYLLTGLTVVMGIATAILTRIPAILMHGSATDLPRRFTTFPTFIAHTLLAELLTLLIAIHVAAALIHQFVLRDGLVSWMLHPAREGSLAGED